MAQVRLRVRCRRHAEHCWARCREAPFWAVPVPDVGGLWLAVWMEHPGEPVHWDGAVNAWRISGSVFRMGRREWLTEAGWHQAYDDGVRTVIDLRNPSEHGLRETDPAVSPVVLAAFDVVHAPTEDPDHPEFKELCSPYLNDPACYAANARLFPDKLVAVFKAVAAAPAGVVIHCSAGRDRSGMVAAMLQDLTGAPDHEIVTGYQAAMRAINERHRMVGPPHKHERYLDEGALLPLLKTRGGGALEFVRRLDTTNYLLRHGLTAAELAAIRSRLASRMTM